MADPTCVLLPYTERGRENAYARAHGHALGRARGPLIAPARAAGGSGPAPIQGRTSGKSHGPPTRTPHPAHRPPEARDLGKARHVSRVAQRAAVQGAAKERRYKSEKKNWDTNINICTETAHTHVSQRSLAALPPPCSLHQSQVTVGGPLRWPAPAPLSGQKPDPRSPLSPLAPSSLSLFLQQTLSPSHQSITHLLVAL